MANAKGTSVIFIKNRLTTGGSDKEAIFVSKLPEDIKKVYYKTLSISWIPVEDVATMMETAATIIYPDEREALFKLGEEEALDNLNGIYKVLLKMTTVPFLVKQTAKLWRSYHAEGEADVVFDNNQGTMSVRGYPDFPSSMREITRGYIAGALSLTRAQDVVVTLDDSDKQCWKWNCKWK